MGKTAMKILQNRAMMAIIGLDAVCWGALVFFAIHFFQCPAA